MSKVSHQLGFTLSELLVCLAVISLTLAVSIPYSRHSRASRDQLSFAHSLEQVLRGAQQRAIMRNEESIVYIDLKQREIAPSSGTKIAIPDSIQVSLLTSEGEIRGNAVGYRFYPEGGSTGGRIILSGERDQQIVSINWLTGQVRLSSMVKP